MVVEVEQGYFAAARTQDNAKNFLSVRNGRSGVDLGHIAGDASDLKVLLDRKTSSCGGDDVVDTDVGVFNSEDELEVAEGTFERFLLRCAIDHPLSESLRYLLLHSKPPLSSSTSSMTSDCS